MDTDASAGRESLAAVSAAVSRLAGGVEVRFEDVDGDGDREVVVANAWLRAVLRFPERVGEAYYGRRFTWGGRLQSLVYLPTGREHFKTEMLDPEDVRPFGLPDELFARFPLTDDEDGRSRSLKMGVGVTTEDGDERTLEPLPWTWHTEEDSDETVVVFRQEVRLDPYDYVYEKRYRFHADAAWFAMDVVWENRGDEALASDWDIHSFHVSGAPPVSSWLVAPKRAWVSCGATRMRTILKEPSPILAMPEEIEMMADLIDWDVDETPWWYALGPGDGDEFYLLRARFEPYRGLFWTAWEGFTPQGISHVEVPPGDRAVWGYDVTLGRGGRHFVRAGEDCGLTVEAGAGSVTVAVHTAANRSGRLEVSVEDARGAAYSETASDGEVAPEAPLVLEASLPDTGDVATVRAAYREGEHTVLAATEFVALAPQRPTARLPFTGDGDRVLVASHHAGERADKDGLFLYSHGTEAGFDVAWDPEAGPTDAAARNQRVICLVGDAWPLARVPELRTWVEGGGGLLLCAPFGELARALGDAVPLTVSGDGRLQAADERLGLQLGARHWTSERLMLHPDGEARIGFWTPATATTGAIVCLRFTDVGQHPALAVWEVGAGRVAALATRPAWGVTPTNAIWSGWGQYHRALFAGLMGWLARRDEDA